ncbi:MAG TPA: clostripain-related cysteine peptidase [Stenomitos sp.]
MGDASRRLIYLILPAVLAGCGVPSPFPATSPDRVTARGEGAFPERLAPKRATVLSYQAVNNNLQSSLPFDLDVMESVIDPEAMNVLVEADTLNYRFSWAKGFENVGFRNKDKAYRFFVSKDVRAGQYASPYVDLPDPDSGSGSHLQSFIEWGFSRYPARLKVLDIRSHGHGPLGLADDFSSKSRIFLPELQAAIEQGLAGPLDVLTTKACLMASVEAGYQLSGCTKVLVGSEDGMLTNARMDSLLYRNLDLAAQATSPQDFAVAYVKKAMALQQPDKRTATTLSAIDLTKLKGAIAPMRELSAALLALLPQRKAEVAAAVAASKNWGRSQAQTDLVELCTNLERLGDPRVGRACTDVKQALASAVLVAVADADNQAGSHGLTILTRITTGDDAANGQLFAQYQRTTFDRETGWSKVLEGLGAFGPPREDKNG